MAIKKIAEELLSRYDLSRYQFVGTIFIEEKKISYYRAYFEGSGYIVLGGGSFNDSDPLKIEKDVLEVYLHEQLHHFFEYHPSKVSFLTEIERMFPSESLPAHEKNSDLLGTYEHFAVCFLTVQALRRLNGMCPVVAGRRSNWLYTIIENKFSEIAELLRKHRMLVEDEIL